MQSLDVKSILFHIIRTKILYVVRPINYKLINLVFNLYTYINTVKIIILYSFKWITFFVIEGILNYKYKFHGWKDELMEDLILVLL